MFSSKSFIVYGLIFRFFIPFEFIIMYGAYHCCRAVWCWSGEQPRGATSRPR